MTEIVASTETVTTPLVDTVADTAAPLTNGVLETERGSREPGRGHCREESSRPLVAARGSSELMAAIHSPLWPTTPLADTAASVPATSPILDPPILDPLSLPDPSIAAGALGELAAGQSAGSLADPGLVASATNGLVAISPGSDSGTDGSAPLQGLLDALGGLDPADQRLLVSAGIIAVTTIAFTPAGADNVLGTCAANARLTFTNMRLIPCMAEETARRYAATAGQTLSNFTGGGSAGRSAGDVRDVTRSRSNAAAIRDGFARATGGFAESEDDGDGRLMVQVGVALGAVYLSFLTLWFWATRLRWRPRT